MSKISSPLVRSYIELYNKFKGSPSEVFLELIRARTPLSLKKGSRGIKMIKKADLYKNLTQKTLTNMIKRELIFNYVYDNSLAVAESLATRMVGIIAEYSPSKASVLPGQMVWLAIDREDYPARAKKISATKMKSVILTLVSAEDIKKLWLGKKATDIYPDIIARLCLESEDQGRLLTLVDLSKILNLSLLSVTKYKKKWETAHSKILPTGGSIHDMGKTFTHKSQILSLYLEGATTSEIARTTGHDPVNVDRYIGDFQRILLLYEDGNPASKICFYTGLGRKLVSEYINFIKEHNITHTGVDMLNIKLSNP